MKWLALFLALMLPAAARGNDGALLYMRTPITITRQQPPPTEALPWQDPKTPQPAQVPAVTFDVEIREAAAYYRQEGWFSLSSPQENGAVLMVFATSGIAPISPSPHYAPLDILMINQEGVITQIVPNIQLSLLDRDIVPEKDVLAFMFIKGGSCEKLSIKPGDTLEYPKIFKKAPVVLGK